MITTKSINHILLRKGKERKGKERKGKERKGTFFKSLLVLALEH